jgi:uridine phosphorylase
MESSTLYVVGASLGIKTGSVFLCVWNQERFAAGLDDASNETHDTEKAIKTAVEAIRILIKGGSL